MKYRALFRPFYKDLVARTGFLPALLVVSSVGRYPNSLSDPIALPMVLALSVAFVTTQFFLSFRHYNLFNDHIGIATSSLVLTNLVACAILLAGRFYYSLGFIAIFVGLSFIVTLYMEHRRIHRSRNEVYYVIPIGDWETLKSSSCKLNVISSIDGITEVPKEVQIIADLDNLTPPFDRGFFIELAARGHTVVSLALFQEYLSGQVDNFNFRHQSISLSEQSKGRGFRRILEAMFCIGFLIVLAVPSLLVAIILFFSSSESVLFKQQRIGLHGQRFNIYKFRTMRDTVTDDGTTTTDQADPRVTPFGRVLRRWRIDEWPQLWNVLKGEMSLVGPRPEQPTIDERFCEEIPGFKLRHSVLPGITGWAQIHLGYTSTSEEAQKKIRYDLYYIKHQSLTLDLSILVQTIVVLFSGDGVR